MHFLGARYLGQKECKHHQTWVCYRWLQPKKTGFKSSYILFHEAVKSKIQAEHPHNGFSEIARLIGLAYRRLSASEKDYYRRKSEETKTFEANVDQKCDGRLKFKRVDGRVQTDLDGLIRYTEHSEWFVYTKLTFVRIESGKNADLFLTDFTSG